MFQPDTFAFHVTYTCPLTCKHCCFRSSPQVKDSLDSAFILESIDAIPKTIKLVVFTGGEPFLHGDRLVEYVARAHGHGFRTRVVTSAYFARSAAEARRRIEPLVAAGLSEVSISWDDYHEEFVTFDCVKHLVVAARDAGIDVGIAMVQAEQATWTRERIIAELDLGPSPPLKIGENGVNRTGRADDVLQDEPLKQKGYVGPCPFILTGPTISAKGVLMPCCGVIPNTDQLTIKRDPKPSELPDLIDQSLKNPLFLWLFLRGPYAIMQWIADKHDLAIPARDSLGGICEACKLLFETPEFACRIDEIVSERQEFLEGEQAVMEALVDMNTLGAVRLWADQSKFLERSAPTRS